MEWGTYLSVDQLTDKHCLEPESSLGEDWEWGCRGQFAWIMDNLEARPGEFDIYKSQLLGAKNKTTVSPKFLGVIQHVSECLGIALWLEMGW
jgi:hypothetical protein